MAGEADVERLVERAVGAVSKEHSWPTDADMRKMPPVAALLETKGDERHTALLLLADRAANRQREKRWGVTRLVRMLARRKLDLAFPDALALITAVDRAVARGDEAGWLGNALVDQLEASAEAWTPEETAIARPLLERVKAGVTYEPAVGLRLGAIGAPVEGLPLDLLGPMRAALTAALEALPEPEPTVAALLTHAAALSATGKPSKTWLAQARVIADDLRDPAAMRLIVARSLIDFAALPFGDPAADAPYVSQTGQLVGGGLLWMAVLGAGAEDMPTFGAVARAFMNTYGSGEPRSLRLANTGIVLCGRIGGQEALSELLALERGTRHGSLLATIRKTIDALAAAQGLTRDQLLERGVEDHGLGADGYRTFALSVGAARVGLHGNAAVLEYSDGAGAVKRSVPASVKADSATALDDVKGVMKALRRTIAAERVRLDALLSSGRRWTNEDWQRYYAAHPMTGALVRRVVWRFTAEDGDEVVGLPTGPEVDSVRTADGTVTSIPAGAEVRLWHPIEAEPAEVAAWRARCIADEIVQPIKQAFRETYAPTPAEAETGDYSNRFAGHVFRQVQARALLKGRGWKPVPVSWWDDGIDHGVARRADEVTGITAEFFFDPIAEGDDFRDNLYTYCTSDQVRFRRTDAAAAADDLPLSEIPPLLFTETMRDVDLVIGVASIGADPEWLDRGGERRFTGYWNEVAFGPMTAAAEIRREVLVGLMPRLAIADQCTLETRHLVVRGELGTYRIHLGSANVQMDPDDRYLCIVRAPPGKTGRLFLPFDDDPLLSLVLSKAFMLAADTAITDPTILAQMRPIG